MPNMKRSAASRLPWPLYMIDFEASSLEPGGYPIEVGLALWPAADEPIFSWSSLIRPTDDWLKHGDWSKASREVHGISQNEAVRTGREPVKVAKAINEALSQSGVVWCDGGPYDAQWARTLFKAAGLKMVCPLGDWHQLVAAVGGEARENALEWLERIPPRHRAREDAEHLLHALAYAVGAKAGPVQQLEALIPALAALNQP
jgi:hypothetical protein